MSEPLANALCRRLGIRFPLFGVARQIEVVAAISLAGGLGISSIPTLMVFRDGILLYREAGALPGNALEDLISQVEALDMDEVRAKVAEQEKTGQSQA